MALHCPSCTSVDLMTRHATGIERLLISFTGKRKYRCRNCQTVFRGPERRRLARSDDDRPQFRPAP